MSNILKKLRLDFNPFEPAATGAPIHAKLSPPKDLESRMEELLDLHQIGVGVKAIVIVGEYGTGKTCLLQWLHNEVFPSRQIKSFYFDNPGVQFYDLANMLLRTIGRKDFAKFIWELAGSHVPGSHQTSLFEICEEIRVVRRRGNSAQQMGKYGRMASRESVVIFEKP